MGSSGAGVDGDMSNLTLPLFSELQRCSWFSHSVNRIHGIEYFFPQIVDGRAQRGFPGGLIQP